MRIRLDAGFSGPELYAFFEAQKLDYVVGMAKNAWLTDLAEPLMAEVRSEFEPRQQTTRRYGECAYQAGSWPHERRVIVKAEVTAHIGRQPKDNPRFVVTNLKTSPRHVYEDVYCARAMLKTGSRNSSSTLRSTAPVARVSSPTSCGC